MGRIMVRVKFGFSLEGDVYTPDSGWLMDEPKYLIYNCRGNSLARKSTKARIFAGTK